MSEESTGAKERSWASIKLGREGDHKEKKERIKIIIEKSRNKTNSESAYPIFCKVYFFKGWPLLLLTQGIGFLRARKTFGFFFFPFLFVIGGVGRGKPPENSVTGKKKMVCEFRLSLRT